MTEPTKSAGKDSNLKLSAGEQLKQARAERNLTVQQVGQALHLDTWILEALEDDRFKDVGAPVFVKGHLRKYAAEVGVDQDAMMEAYYRSEDPPETPQLVTDTFSRPDSNGRGRWPVILVSAVIVLVIVAVSAWWMRGGGFGSGDASEPQAATGTEIETRRPPGDDFKPLQRPDPVPGNQPPAESEAVESPPSAVDDQAIVEDNSASQLPTAALPAVPDEPQDDGRVSLSISFENDSWVEIYDASRRRLFFDLARTGTTRTVKGAAPLQVLLGNAENARVRVNGEVWPIPAAARRGKTARFTVR